MSDRRGTCGAGDGRRSGLVVGCTVAMMVVTVGVCNGAGFDLVRDGKPIVGIVYQDETSGHPMASGRQKQRFQACIEDFRQIVNRMSGAELTAVSAKDAADKGPENTIQVGLTPAAQKKGLDKRVGKLKPHALLIHADPASKVLYLLGSTLEGSGHALYEFLESLGCRWYMPGPFGEKLPTMKTITVKQIDLVREPEFELRAIQLRARGSVAPGTKTREEVMEWMRRSKFGGSGPSRGHQFATLVPQAKYLEEHPEYYSLRDGQRRPTHLCMTNPAVLKAAEAHLTAYFTKNPSAGGYPVALADGRQYCECPKCTKACGGNPQSIMSLYLSFTKELFDRIDKKFPGREFQYGFYVYSNLMDVPKGKIPKQLAPYIAPLGYDAFHTTADPKRYLGLSVAKDWPPETIERIKADPRSYLGRLVHRVMIGWGDGSQNMYLRDYDPYVTFAQNMPLVRTYQLAIEIPWHKEIGVRGYTPEATANSWFTSGLNFWVRSRFYWDTKLDIKAAMEDYCKGMFGAAWEPMYWFLDALARRTIESPAFRHGDHVLARLYSVAGVEGLDFHLRQAEALATTDFEKERVNMWRLCQQHMLRYLHVRRAELEGDFENAANLADDYLRFLDYIHRVNSHFVDNRWYAEREFSMQGRARQYRQYAAKLNGEQGRLLLKLPTLWWFKHDPQDVGVKEGWYKLEPVSEYDPEKGADATVGYPPIPGWRLQSPEKSWQTSDEDYEGYNWYRTQLRLPKALAGTKVSMLVTGIFGHMDFFVNGQRVSWFEKPNPRGENAAQEKVEAHHLDLGSAWSWNYNEGFEVDITKYLRLDATNTFAFRTRDMWRWGGIFKRVLLFTPLVEPSLRTQPPKQCDCSR